MATLTNTQRTATADDLAVVVSWLPGKEACDVWSGRTVAWPVRMEVLPAELRWAEADNVAVMIGDRLAAFGQLFIRPGDVGHLARLIVSPDARGRGLGRHLVSVLMSRSRAAGMLSMSLNVYTSNDVAIRLYEKLGFVASGTEQGKGSQFMTCSLSGSP